MEYRGFGSRMTMPLFTKQTKVQTPPKTSRPPRKPLVDKALFGVMGKSLKQLLLFLQNVAIKAATWLRGAKMPYRVDSSQLQTFAFLAGVVYFVRTAASTFTSMALAALVMYAVTKPDAVAKPSPEKSSS